MLRIRYVISVALENSRGERDVLVSKGVFVVIVKN